MEDENKNTPHYPIDDGNCSKDDDEEYGGHWRYLERATEYAEGGHNPYNGHRAKSHRRISDTTIVDLDVNIPLL